MRAVDASRKLKNTRESRLSHLRLLVDMTALIAALVPTLVAMLSASVVTSSLYSSVLRSLDAGWPSPVSMSLGILQWGLLGIAGMIVSVSLLRAVFRSGIPRVFIDCVLWVYFGTLSILFLMWVFQLATFAGPGFFFAIDKGYLW